MFDRTTHVTGMALEIIQKYETERKYGGIVCFSGLTAKDAKELIDLGALNTDEKQNDAPTVGEFLELAEKHPTMTFHGYRVYPERKDERISFEGFDVSMDDLSKEDIVALAQLHADEFGADDGKLRAWWD